MGGNCHFCEIGDVKPGTATTPSHRNGMVVVVKNVPVDVCANCGEVYISHEIGVQLDAIIKDAEQDGVEVLVRKYLPVKVAEEDPSETNAAAIDCQSAAILE